MPESLRPLRSTLARTLPLLVAAALVGLVGLTPPALAEQLNPPVQRLIQSADLRGTQVAILIRDLDERDTLVDLDGHRTLIPASNAKVPTALAALDILGHDFVFQTRLGITPPPADGSEYAPSLVITADGDPGFGDPDLLAQHGLQIDDLLDQWVAAAQASGQTRFQSLLLDDRIFDAQTTHPDWEPNDLLRPFGAQVAGLNFYRNILDVLPVPSAQFGAAPRVSVYPSSPLIHTQNRARTAASDNFIVHRELGTNNLRFSGTVKSRQRTPLRLTVHDPGMHFAHVFAERLKAQGIAVGPVDRVDPLQPAPATLDLHVVRTGLPNVLQRVNQDSFNLAASALFKRMGHAFTGSPGSWANGQAAVRQALAQRLGSASTAARVTDGSGLARSNQLSPRVLVDLLESAHHDDDVAQPFLASLAYAGTNSQGTYKADGTLIGRFEDMPDGHWVFAKSGFLSGVSSLSGYLIQDPPNQQHLPPRVTAFAFIYNGFRPPVYNSKLKTLTEDILMLVDQHLAQNNAQLGG
ncbi:MAG: D-alanyl-D-alanine carboxypeptidase/D-alanyl-D-alanine-endopeptidase [Planctomycetota bacterium]